MRHKTAKRWLSDEWGGSLSAGRRERLETHLASCPKCREIRQDWDRIQKGSALVLPSEKDAYWSDGLARLRASLDKSGRIPSGGEKSVRPVPGFFPWRTWAWGAGGAGLAAAGALLLILLSPAGPLEDAYALSFGDHRAFLEEGLASDEAVLSEFNESLRSGLAETLEAVPGDVVNLTADLILTLESFSDEDIQIFLNEIALETGVGEK